ncbi:SDR family oxidoreductase [Streptomyces parvulus]|uniref:SDR family oxidoreductase n=1 Tax=Streptomyces parvulus TaxID=146923 RepID=UPI001E3BBF0F|nr:SDR family oxidoreductase [Streptomyces parvulus]MCC9157901.1 SDR family oxidoreductase [Streptomyces parvulus]MCE7690209.1 SDR family oxidoreductase [Streptomyces parvulus]
MTVQGSVALVTGGNRGLGDSFVRALLDAGASKVYAAARDPRKVTAAGAVPLVLDVTDADSVQAAAQQARDVTLLINNAGIDSGASVLEGDFADFRRDFETNVLGSLRVTREFASTLAGNGGGTVLNVLSVLSWLTAPDVASYTASKSAGWSVTNSLRLALRNQGTRVSALHVAYIDTDLARGLDVPKSDPTDIARLTLKMLDEGAEEILADEITKQVKAGLSQSPTTLYPQLIEG